MLYAISIYLDLELSIYTNCACTSESEHVNSETHCFAVDMFAVAFSFNLISALYESLFCFQVFLKAILLLPGEIRSNINRVYGKLLHHWVQ